MKTFQMLSLAAVLGVLVGCGGSPSVPDDQPAPTVKEPDVAVDKIAEAGVPFVQTADPKLTSIYVHTAAMKYPRPRPDPFALRTDERDFDEQQNAERVLGASGGWLSEFTPSTPFNDEPAPIPETQPYRRLAGVVVGDSVLALIDMGNGQTYLVRPGQQIPDTEWTVVSIDMDKAILRRGGNVLPHQITVRLELPPPGMAGAGTGGFNPGGGGFPGGGPPGGPPGGGRPGGPSFGGAGAPGG